MRVVVIGGHGNFGARICRALSATPGIDVIAAGRNPPQAAPGSRILAAQLDLATPQFPRTLAELSPNLVILTAEASHGPEIPVMAAILLARKLARGEITARGAFPCMGLLTLADFKPEFARWRISTIVEDS